ncbi:MAG: hypothetical protein H0V66_06460 [Bdellovibrionales bacterium]|nr:hypothetical protein [Bdellovibrionales bacterium]
MDKKEEFKRVKTFMSSMDWFNLTIQQKESFLQDKRLTQGEKTILECSTLLRECKFSEIIKQLEDLKTHNILVESQRYLVLGTAYNSSAMFEEAESCIKRAIEILKQHDLPKYEFNGLLQLFFVHLNLKIRSELPSILDRMQEILTDNLKDKISYLRCRFNYHVLNEDYGIAKSHLKMLEGYRDKMHPSQETSHLVDKFIYFLKLDQFKSCEQTLNELKGLRKYRISVNYFFMQSLLAHYMHKKPIYLYDKDFKDYPCLHAQLKVIQMLESGNISEAKKFWEKLGNISPTVYCEFMDYQGDKCLFSICLGLYQHKQQGNDISDILSNNLQEREKEFLLMLSLSPTPVMKEEIHLKIWGRPIEGKEDLNKIIMLVGRLKKKTGVEIKSIKGCYTLVLKPEKNKKVS